MREKPVFHRADPPQAVFLDTRGNTTLGVGICDRCHFKFPLGELYPDGNTPGLMVCRADRDVLDPYRLAPPPPDKWNLPFVRPDVPLVNQFGDVPIIENPEYVVEILTTASGEPVTADGEEIIIEEGIVGTNAVIWPEPQSNPAFPNPPGNGSE